MEFQKSEIGMLTDLYELTMANVYFNINENGNAVFSFYVRPTKKRNFFIFSGLNELIDYILNIKFSEEDIKYLKSIGLFSNKFLEYLRNFKFSGNLYAVKEGTIFFPNEPVVQIEAPLIEAQTIETFLINVLQLPILVASKSARCYLVAEGRILVDFSLRRTHGIDAGLKVAYSSYMAGFDGTSNVLAGKTYEIKVVGTMAHSFILALQNEERAFEEFAKVYPENTIFLVDTFNTIEGVKKAIKVIKKLGLKNLHGIRIDSGDLVKLSKEARRLLDEAGFKEAKIIASGGLDEYKIEELLKKGAKIDGFGVGTKLGVSADLPYLDCVYKLVEYKDKPVAKFSENKTTYPFKKQIYRVIKDGKIFHDYITKFDEKAEETPLIEKYIENGKLIKELPSLEEIKKFTLSQLKLLPEELKDIHTYKGFLPTFSKSILNATEELKKSYR